jgi:hypothetical protein
LNPELGTDHSMVKAAGKGLAYDSSSADFDSISQERGRGDVDVLFFFSEVHTAYSAFGAATVAQ